MNDQPPSGQRRALSDRALALRARRADLGLSIRRAAPLLGVSWQHLSLLETDHNTTSASRYRELLAAYDRLELDS